ncbi:MAG TPA: DNA-3-methyladenine glycosylase 2 family protein, partial [Fusibacter sp.]|nr:DNA-3-methyladenine glycosylase 2 family protein [Fusibacter sp.]
YFEYGDEAIHYLKKKDKKLGAAIDRIGPIQREIMPDLFKGLISSIIAQQISSKAADTVWKRFELLVGDVTPQNVSLVDVADIQTRGMSMRKANYIKAISEMIHCGAFNLEELATLPDEEITKRLKSLPGIGIWTAEMLMIFSMQRQNIVSWDDLAIRRGMMRLYGKTELDRATFESYKKRYTPYGSVASLYLWALSVEPI